MLVMAAAVAAAGGGLALFNQYRALFTQWADYLLRYGADPEDQNCTDDFSRHMAHNCNLGVKAVMGIASMALLLERAGEQAAAEPYWQQARALARDWAARAAQEGGGFRLAFDKPGTFSLKYNIVWDKIFGTGLFTEEELADEFASYWQYMNPYGVPLDCRGSTSKTDWACWRGTPNSSRSSWRPCGGTSTRRRTAYPCPTGTAPRRPSTSMCSTARCRAGCSSS